MVNKVQSAEDLLTQDQREPQAGASSSGGHGMMEKELEPILLPVLVTPGSGGPQLRNFLPSSLTPRKAVQHRLKE